MNDPGSNSVFWATFDGVTTIFAALSFVLKEMTFKHYKTLSNMRFGLRQSDAATDTLKTAIGNVDGTQSKEELDVFLAGSICALVGLLVSLPADLIIHHIMHPPKAGEPNTLEGVILGLEHLVGDKQTLTWYSIYISVNLAFNVFFLLLTSYGSALTCFVCLKMCTPIIGFLSALDWPVIGAHPVDPKQWVLLAVMLVAVCAYRDGTTKRETREVTSCCWPWCTRKANQDAIGC